MEHKLSCKNIIGIILAILACVTILGTLLFYRFASASLWIIVIIFTPILIPLVVGIILGLSITSIVFTAKCKGFKYLWIVTLVPILLILSSIPIGYGIRRISRNKANIANASYEIVLNTLNEGSRTPLLSYWGDLDIDNTQITVKDNDRKFYTVIKDLELTKIRSGGDQTIKNGEIQWYVNSDDDNPRSYFINIYPTGIIRTSVVESDSKSNYKLYRVDYRYDAALYSTLYESAKSINAIYTE